MHLCVIGLSLQLCTYVQKLRLMVLDCLVCLLILLMLFPCQCGYFHRIASDTRPCVRNFGVPGAIFKNLKGRWKWPQLMTPIPRALDFWVLKHTNFELSMIETEMRELAYLTFIYFHHENEIYETIF